MSLKWAGTWIGYLERIIILTFVLHDQYEAIGLLIAAKSLLRFRDTNDARPQTEYVLIGTLASLAGALINRRVIEISSISDAIKIYYSYLCGPFAALASGYFSSKTLLL